jgi:hypothetical protein
MSNVGPRKDGRRRRVLSSGHLRAGASLQWTRGGGGLKEAGGPDQRGQGLPARYERAGHRRKRRRWVASPRRRERNFANFSRCVFFLPPFYRTAADPSRTKYAGPTIRCGQVYWFITQFSTLSNHKCGQLGVYSPTSCGSICQSHKIV